MMWSGIALALVCLGAALPPLWKIATSSGEYLAVGPVPASVLVAQAAVALRLSLGRAASAAVAALGGVLLFAKPLVQPVMHDTGPFSFTSETHLYYVVPGLSLMLLALLLGALAGTGGMRARAAGIAATAAAGAVVLLGSFFVGRGQLIAVFTLLVPGVIAAALAVLLVARLPGMPTALAFQPTFFVSEPYATDPSLRSLVRAVAQAPPAHVTGTRFGHFEILELLGEGGMGRVYRTRDHRLMREVALKILPPELAHDAHRRERLQREARAAARVNHPNVAALYDMGASEDGVPFLVFELCRGRPLRALVGMLDAARGWHIAVQIADGLAAAHACHIVHRDLKPENVMVDEHDQVKILDFGVARAADASLGAELTQEAMVIGTPAYMSPEQAMALAVDARSDVFSFGTVLAELLTGHCPFVRATTHATRLAVIDVEVPRACWQALPEPARGIVERCLQRDPGRRYGSAAEVASALRAMSAR